MNEYDSQQEYEARQRQYGATGIACCWFLAKFLVPVGIVLFLFACALGSTLAHAQTGAPVAWFTASDIQLADTKPGGSNIYPIGYERLVREYAGPKLKANGWTRFAFHNPGGSYTRGWTPKTYAQTYSDLPTRAAAQAKGIDIRTMWCDQAQEAQLLYGDELFDPVDYEKGVNLLTDLYGQQEVFIYIGDPGLLPDPYLDGLRAVQPWLVRDEISFIFDSTGWEGNATYFDKKRLGRVQCLIDRLKKMGHGCSIEGRPAPNQNDWRNLQGTFAKRSTDVTGNQADHDEAAGRLGEIFTLTNGAASDGDTVNWPAEVTPVCRQWMTRKASDVEAN